MYQTKPLFRLVIRNANKSHDRNVRNHHLVVEIQPPEAGEITCRHGLAGLPDSCFGKWSGPDETCNPYPDTDNSHILAFARNRMKWVRKCVNRFDRSRPPLREQILSFRE